MKTDIKNEINTNEVVIIEAPNFPKNRPNNKHINEPIKGKKTKIIYMCYLYFK